MLPLLVFGCDRELEKCFMGYHYYYWTVLLVWVLGLDDGHSISKMASNVHLFKAEGFCTVSLICKYVVLIGISKLLSEHTGFTFVKIRTLDALNIFFG